MRDSAESLNIGIKSIVAAVVTAVVMLVFVSACGAKAESVDVAFSPDSSYTMRATGVSSLISDSGITRYRLIAEEWLIFSKAAEPYWYFPEGFYVEQFDSLFNPEGSVKADTAYYFINKEEWLLIRNVRLTNLQDEKFDSEKITWNQKEQRIHSDEYIRIEQKEKIITGYGFESNQEMTHYRIFNPQGTFPIPEDNAAGTGDSTDSDQSAVVGDLPQPSSDNAAEPATDEPAP